MPVIIVETFLDRRNGNWTMFDPGNLCHKVKI